MTPDDLVRWRERMGWLQVDAAAALGMSRRAYQHLEGGTTSRGRPVDTIPKLAELACAELTRRRAEGSV
jgi:transcriptional regulator with XRE-family HTH domain